MTSARTMERAKRRFGIDRAEEFEARKGLIASINDPAQRLLSAAKWVIETNGDAVVGRDGRQVQTLGMVIAAHALVDAIRNMEAA